MHLVTVMFMSFLTIIGNGVKQAPGQLVALASTGNPSVVQAADEVDIPPPVETPDSVMEISTTACPPPVEPAEPSAEPTAFATDTITIEGTIVLQGIEVPFSLAGVMPGLAVRVGSYEFTVNTPTDS